MAKPITGKTHVGERREKRPNGDIYVYARITAYDEKARKTYTVSQNLKGKIKAGTQEIVPTRPKKTKATIVKFTALYSDRKVLLSDFIKILSFLSTELILETHSPMIFLPLHTDCNF